MEAAKQEGGIEIATGRQRARMSSSRMIFIGAMVLTALYVAWGIAKIIL